VAPLLGIVAQLGVILYMFVVGLELDLRALGERGRAAVAISHASIVAPFLLGAALALGIYPVLATRDVPFTAFALFLGVSLSVTAFPVLARILTDRKLHKTSLGVVALACAAVDDVTAWCLLALVVGVAQSEVGSALSVAALTLGYIGGMYLIVRPLVARIVPRWETRGLSKGALAAVFAGLLFSSFITERIGIHAIFGAFLLGAVVPHDSRLARELSEKLEAVVTVLLLPAFFAYTGMRTEIGLLSGLQNWLICGVIILVATLGKFGGTLAAARLTGLSWRDSASLGILMNTRGLMELIVLNIGLDLGVISPTLFAMMVVMAIVTTLATSPILQLLQLRRTSESVSASAEKRDAVAAG
jgi:Kef-type K+ transport system membrane component KefB